MAKKILIADDDPAIVDALGMILEDAGYEVAQTGNGRRVQEMKDELPDLLLLDIRMSGMDGTAICKHWKSQSQTRHIPIIIVSANRDTKQLAKEAGADDFLEKPFNMNDLLRKVAQYTGG